MNNSVASKTVDRLEHAPVEQLVLLGVFLNALLFSVFIACPVIRDDGWYTLDVFIRKYFIGTLSLQDFFTKRGAFDHAMPLQRLVEIIQYKYFNGDYLVMSLTGVFAGGIGALFLLRLIKMARSEDNVTTTSILASCAVFCVYLSINSRWIFDWPLVTMEYVIFLAVFVYFFAIWKALNRNSFIGLGASAVVLGIIADDTSLIAALASIGVVILYAWRAHRWRTGGLVIAIVVTSFLITTTIYAIFFTTPIEISSTKALTYLWHQLLDNGGWWKAVYIPLCSSVIFPEHLSEIFGAGGPAVGFAITICLIFAHVMFWRKIFTQKLNLLLMFSAQLMLFFYGLVAGVIYTRVASFDINYLMQPRYVLLYQLNLVALFMAAIGVGLSEGHGGEKKWTNVLVAIAASAIVCLQFPLGSGSWQSVKYVSALYQSSVQELGRMQADRTYQPSSCSGILAICDQPPEKRQDLLKLLSDNKENIFSEDFQAFHRLYPNLDRGK